ncbi:MAG: hypothetical protein ACOVQD_04260, partial [Planktothrix agardhii]|uniref:hypothetical protein n=1 Tax=Planktothrix agardhii TaxID=1160 RepID=UPI003B9D3961
KGQPSKVEVKPSETGSVNTPSRNGQTARSIEISNRILKTVWKLDSPSPEVELKRLTSNRI